MKKIILIFLFIFELYNAQTVYRVNNANDISSAMNTAQPGDTLVMASGFWVDQRIYFEGNGTPEKQIVLKAEDGGKVFITGKSYLRIGGSYLVVDGLNFVEGYSPSGAVIEFRTSSSKLASYCRLTNTAITEFNPPNSSDDNKWVSLYGEHNRVDHCYFGGKRNSGTTLVVWMDSQPDYHLIDSNYFGYRPELGYNGGETIRIGTSDWSMRDSKTIVEYNLFEKCDGETEIISNKSGHNIYRYNTFLESKGTLTLRHGNDCEVYSNFFFGNGKTKTGGVRIIGERHKVYNNYFQDLTGSGYYAAICMVKGVENSPLNRYFQVKEAQVINNTIVNCSQPFAIGYGSSSDQTLPPKDITIANNVAYTGNQIFKYYEIPENPVFSQNVVFDGPIGIDPVPDGILYTDPMLELSGDSLYRPNINSPLIDAGDTSFAFVSDDFDGQLRSVIDIGADEVSDDPVLRKPITKDDVGPSWYPLPAPPKTVITVMAGVDSLLKAIQNAESGVVIELVSDGGVYSNTDKLVINKNLIIRGKSGLNNKPVISINYDSPDAMIFQIEDGVDLTLKNLTLDGGAESNLKAKYLLATGTQAFTNKYSLTIDSCEFRDVNINDSEGSFFKAFPGTRASQISISNSTFVNSGAEGFSLNSETHGSGNYNVDQLTVTNCLFANISKEAINVYAGDNVPFTPGPSITIDHVTFYNCGSSGTATINAEEVDGTIVKNSIIAESSLGAKSIRLFGLGSEISYTDVWNSGDIELNRSATLGKRIVDYDPKFEHAAAGNYNLLSNSPVLLRGEGKTPMGDLNLAKATPSVYPLDYNVEGNGRVQVNLSNDYFIYSPGTSLSVTAIPDSGYQFKEWTGDLNSSNNPLNFLMLGAIEVTAHFDKLDGVENLSATPKNFKLYQNYPNPFNPSTQLRFDIPEAGFVKVELLNVLGEKLRTVKNEFLSPGSYNITVDGSRLSSGIYFIRLSLNNYTDIIKITLMK